MGTQHSTDASTHHTHNYHNTRDTMRTSEVGGFHLFEVHMPTVHLGLSALLLLALLVLCVYGVYRCCRRKKPSTQLPYFGYPGYPAPDVRISYADLLRESRRQEGHVRSTPDGPNEVGVLDVVDRSASFLPEPKNKNIP